MKTRLAKRFLPAKICKVSRNIFLTKEEVLEIEHLKNVTMYDFKLGNLIFNVIKAEKQVKEAFNEIPF